MSSGHAQRFGPYIILDRIGDGGMAEIFLAKVQGYSGFEKLLALKKIHPKYSRNDTFAQMLIHEAKLAAALTHFNVVQVHDLGEIEGQVYIAMEYIRGRDLAAVLSNTYRRKERLPVELSLFIGTEFITGLEYAHRMRASDGTPLGIIHRDISPQNVLISYEGEVKVTDFGIARIISEKNGFKLPGNLHGKFGYMSPEQALNKEIDQRSDVFSAGVVLWEMLVGARLFRGRDQHDTIEMVASKSVPLPSSINPEVPSSVDRICIKALARERNQRYQTMGALLGELSRVADSLARRAGSRDLSVFMRRQFGTPSGGFRPGQTTNRVEPSGVSEHSGFSGNTEDAASNLSTSTRTLLGQILVRQGAINLGELELALAEQRAQGGRIGEVLVSIGAIDDAELSEALGVQTNLPTIPASDLLALPPAQELIARYPREAAEASCILPIAVDPAQRTVRLAVCDPYDDKAVLEAKVVLGVNDVALLVAPRTAIRQALEAWYEPQGTPEPPASEALFDEGPTEEVIVEEGLEPRVLIADQDRELAETLAARVRLEGWVVDVVLDGKSARSLCRSQPPQIAFFDASLPGIDGYNLLLELRTKNPGAAIFITSERGDEFRQAKALELGADDFFVKPLGLEVTTSKIRREMQRRATSRSPAVAPMHFSGVSGSLEDMSVLDIAQSLELGRKTAHVVIQYEDGPQGILRIDEGQVRAAVADTLQGTRAFYRLARPGIGLFRIEYRPSSIDPNIHVANTELIIEAMRRIEIEAAELGALGPQAPAKPLVRTTAAPDPAPPPRAEMPDLGPQAMRRPSGSRPSALGPKPIIGWPSSGIEPIPLAHRELTGDLTLEEAPEEPSPQGERLEDWVEEQLESAANKPAPPSRPSSGTGVARIPLRRKKTEE